MITPAQCRAAQAEWQPIETAPKNQYVLVGTTDPHGNFGTRVVVSRLLKSHTRLITGKFWGWDHTGANWTHWMPIPSPPEIT
jgi:hypothetical protein